MADAAGEKDRELVRLIDAAMAEAARRSGAWIACRPGCVECCKGPFEITLLDARRLRAGLEVLSEREPERAARVTWRAREVIARGDVLSDDEFCPALDPESGLCDLYEARPVTCRVFGPAVRGEGGAVGACELCYEGASDEEIAACAVEPDPEGVEEMLVEEAEAACGRSGALTVAAALAG